jgi:N-acetylmuramic acid 6-phosphate etherase
MVDVQAVNKKLVRRSEDMLIRLTACTREAAQSALVGAKGSVKLAVLLLNGCDVEEGIRLLERSQGHLRAALMMLQQRDSDAA